MKKFFMFFLLSFVLVLGACGNGDDDADTTDDVEEDADTEEVVDEEEATEDEEATDEEEEADDSASTSDFDAEEFARTNCTACHGQDFTGAMGPDLTGLDEGTITDAVREGPGSMPSYNENQISDEDLDVLAGFFSEM
ncbi:c-type cytochrome [Aliicoccus persicus]|uniref:Cytochrome C oxidase, cbb3-type, subunit III n=1 Tax=Aliicoccus persicus TaxID=930138 RepID=A0A662Z309_9STAP|nr:cytochrome c [Aliicoccus persicus]SEW00495.1 Cytochrome C oxidase, cbb3-type, subunit III [Aliicoccus persicus]